MVRLELFQNLIEHAVDEVPPDYSVFLTVFVVEEIAHGSQACCLLHCCGLTCQQLHMLNTEDVLLIYVPQQSVSALQACAVPVLRQHQHDDVLPDLPEEVHLLPDHTLHRPAASWVLEEASWQADAADAFAGTQQNDGLVITASRCKQQLPGVLTVNSNCNGRHKFPWHPRCQHITARGCSVGGAELSAAAARGKARLVQQQQRQGVLEVDCTWWPAQLVPVALLNEQPFLQDLAHAIQAHNTRILSLRQCCKSQQQRLPPLIVPLLLQTVQRTAAAVALQSAWRSHSSRIQHCIADKLLCKRAACAIQRAWRAYVLRSRLAMLAAAAVSHRHAQTQLRFSCIMCLDVAGVRLLEAAVERCRLGSVLFPEHRLWYAVEPEQGDLFLIEPPGHNNSNDSCGDDDSSSSRVEQEDCPDREGLPAWLGANIPVIPAGCAAAEGALSRAHAAKLLELCCSVKDLLDPSRIAAGSCSPSDVAQLVTFRTKQQAAQRAALLAVYTYDMRTGEYTKLMTVQESPLGAAYRSLTALSTTNTNSSTAQQMAVTTQHPTQTGRTAQCVPAATATAAATATCSAQPSSSTATVQATASLPGISTAHRATAGAPSSLTSPNQGSLVTRTQLSKGEHNTVKDAAAPSEEARGAGSTAALPAGPTSSSPRMLGFAVPLQPIHPTQTLLAATEPHQSSTQPADPIQSGDAVTVLPAASGLHLYISVLSRFPYLVKELAALETAQTVAGAAEAVGLAEAPSTEGPRVVAAGADGEVQCPASRSGSQECSTRDDDCCLTSQAPCCIAGQPDVISLGAYQEKTKLQQVEAFKAKLTAEAHAAAATAAMEDQAKHQAVAGARAGGMSSDTEGTGPTLLSTNNVVAPSYWPDTTLTATAAAQALRQQAEAAAAANVAAQRAKQQQSAAEAAAQEQKRHALKRAAAQADKQSHDWRLHQVQQQQQASAHKRADTLKHVRAMAPTSRHKQQQQLGAFASQCNQLSKYMRNHVTQRARAIEQHSASQRVQQLRHEEAVATETMKQSKHDTTCAAQTAVQQQLVQSETELAAVKAIHELEEAAKRAAAAARRHHERCRAGLANQQRLASS